MSLSVPFPMFSQRDWYVSDNAGVPGNLHVRSRLESLDIRCQAIESYRYASLFFQSALLSFEGFSKKRHLDYSRTLERLLNWSFLIARKSVFYWTEQDMRCYLEFVSRPDVLWVTPSNFRRFLRDNSKPFEEWLINPRWRPFCRSITEEKSTPLSYDALQLDRKILLDFLNFIVFNVTHPLSRRMTARAIEYFLLSPGEKPSPGLHLVCEGHHVERNSYELDWAFQQAIELSKSNWRYNLILFSMAVARYTRIPIVSLCCGTDSMGNLNQFQLRSDHKWYFIDKPGTRFERTHKLSDSFYPYMNMHLKFLSLSQDEQLPDHHVFTRPGAKHGFGFYYIKKMVQNFRGELLELALNCQDTVIYTNRDVLAKLTLSMIRQSQPRRKGHVRQREI